MLDVAERRQDTEGPGQLFVVSIQLAPGIFVLSPQGA